MKWISVIAVLAFAGSFLWWISSDDTSAWQGTAKGPAKDFIYAAVDGDFDLATAYCLPEIDEKAREVATRIYNEGIDRRAVSFKETADDPNTLTGLVNGRILTVKVTERGPDDWIITMIDLDR